MALGIIAIQVAKAAKNATDISIDKDDPKGPKINMFVLVPAIIICILTAGSAIITSKGLSSPLSLGQATEFQNTKMNGSNMSQAGKQYSKDTTTKEFNDQKPLDNSISNYVYGTDGTGLTNGIRQTLDKALNPAVIPIDWKKARTSEI